MVDVTVSDTQQTVFNNSTVISNDSTFFSGFGCKEISLVINITASPTGTSPTLQFTLQETDPGDFTTAVGSSVASSVITGTGIQIITLPATRLGSFKVSWAIGGTNSPTFTGVYANIISKIASTVAVYDTSGIALGTSSNPFITKEKRSTSSSVTNVSASASSVTLLSSNSSRLGATFFNDSSNNLYLKLGTTASTSSFTVKILTGGYYELPFGYTGIVDGIWDGTNGACRMCELS